MSNLRWFKKIKNTFVQQPAGTIGRTLRNYFTKPNQSAIWIFGLQKAGTSAVASLFAIRAGKSATIDTPYFWYPYPDRILNNELTVQDLINRYSSPFSKEIIKEPRATFFIEDLAEVFDLNKYVFVVRNPYDNIRSILNRLKLPGNAKNVDLRKVPQEWRWMFSTTVGDDYIYTLAKLWVKANSQKDYIRNKRCVIVRYEDFMKDKVVCIDRLIEEFGLSVVNEIDDLKDKPFQPRGMRDVSWLDFFGPRHYELIYEVCKETMFEFGYCYTH